MKLSDLKNLLSRELTAQLFLAKIATEVTEYKRLPRVKGRSAPIHLVADCTLEVSKEDIKLSCQMFINSTLDDWSFNYVLEALLLSENDYFTNDTVKGNCI